MELAFTSCYGQRIHRSSINVLKYFKVSFKGFRISFVSPFFERMSDLSRFRNEINGVPNLKLYNFAEGASEIHKAQRASIHALGLIVSLLHKFQNFNYIFLDIYFVIDVAFQMLETNVLPSFPSSQV